MTAMAMDPYSSIVEVRIWLTFRSVSVSFGSMTDGGGIVLGLFAIDDVDPLYLVLLYFWFFLCKCMLHQHGLYLHLSDGIFPVMTQRLNHLLWIKLVLLL